MNKRIDATTSFQKKIADFCQARIRPIAEPDELETIQRYMLSLIAFRRAAPSRAGKWDWQAMAAGAGITSSRMGELRRALEPGFDAIGRWLNAAGDVSTSTRASRNKQEFTTKVRKTEKTKVSPAAGTANKTRSEGTAGKKRVVDAHPVPLFEDSSDIVGFQEALRFQMRRHGETYWHVHDALGAGNVKIESTTLLDWTTGKRVPRSVNSFAALAFIERRYRLSEGYFKSRLPNQTQATYGHEVEGMSASERRRIAWHLPDDFNTLSFEKREEVIEWVRRVIITGSTDYRRYHAASIRQRYAIRFPGISYGVRIPT